MVKCFEAKAQCDMCSCSDVGFELYVNRKEAEISSLRSFQFSSLGRSYDFSFCRSFIFTSTVEVHNKAFICIWRSSMYKV